MTFEPGHVDPSSLAFATLSPSEQDAVWFLGAAVTVRAGGAATGGRIAVLEHSGERGYGSPVHSHRDDEETFLILEGELRIEAGETAIAAGPGSAAFLPRRSPHGFVVTSSHARFVTLHTPAGFEQFALSIGTPIDAQHLPPVPAPPVDPVELVRVAAQYGIEILGPPLLP